MLCDQLATYVVVSVIDTIDTFKNQLSAQGIHSVEDTLSIHIMV